MSMKRKNMGRVAGAAATSLALGLTMTQSAMAAAPDAAPFCAGGVIAQTNSTAGQIPDNSATGVTRSITLTGQTGTVRDIDVLTNIVHPVNRELEISIAHTPPGGAKKTVLFVASALLGRAGANGYAGTRWDDSGAGIVAEADLQANGAKPSLVPEGALASFIGDNPNGVWSLTVKDTAAGDIGTLNSFSLDIATATTSPVSTLTTVAGAGGTIPDTHTVANGTLIKTVQVTGAKKYLTDVDLLTAISHTVDPGELEIRLTSPQGTTAVISRRRGSGSLSSLTTRWNDSAGEANLITRVAWAAEQRRAQMVPEGALGAFIGQNPNGTWTLTVQDIADADGFSLNSWSLDLNATDGCTEPPAPVPPLVTPPAPVVVGTPPGPTCVRVGFVVKVLGDKKALRGSLAVVRVKVRNSTLGAAARNAKAKFTIPAGFTLAVKPKGATLKGRALTLNLGAIAGGKSKIVAIKLKAQASAGLGLKKSAISVTAACGSSGIGRIAVTVGRAKA